MLNLDSRDDPETPPFGTTSRPITRPRQPLWKAVIMWIRRVHLYCGLFLLPWAILYGITAFLFNHPTVFSDQPMASYSQDDLAGTPLATLSDPQAIATEVLAHLNATQRPTTPYTLAGPAKFGGRDFAFATVKADGHTVNILFDVKNGGGTVRSTPLRARNEPEKAPFAVGAGGPAGERGDRPPAGGRVARSDGIKVTQPLHERFKDAVPTILERTGFPTGEVTVTSVPDVVFPVEAAGRTWTASYNTLTASINGSPADTKPETELRWRRFLLRLHTAHGYPGETNSRWFWALLVDVMAFALCFWGLSGLLMWWQIKATRKLGAVVLLLSTAAATALGLAMYAVMTG